MTAKEISEHNRAYELGARLVRLEILLPGNQHTSGLDQSARMNMERALRLFARVLELNPVNWSAMWLVGKVLQRLGDWSGAFIWFVRAHEVNSSQPDVPREASLCAMFVGRSEEAISFAHSALRCQPENSGLRANLALAFLLAGKLDQAKEAINAVQAKDVISQTLWRMIDHFIAVGKRPPDTITALEDYWKKHNAA